MNNKYYLYKQKFIKNYIDDNTKRKGQFIKIISKTIRKYIFII